MRHPFEEVLGRGHIGAGLHPQRHGDRGRGLKLRHSAGGDRGEIVQAVELETVWRADRAVALPTAGRVPGEVHERGVVPVDQILPRRRRSRCWIGAVPARGVRPQVDDLGAGGKEHRLTILKAGQDLTVAQRHRPGAHLSDRTVEVFAVDPGSAERGCAEHYLGGLAPEVGVASRMDELTVQEHPHGPDALDHRDVIPSVGCHRSDIRPWIQLHAELAARDRHAHAPIGRRVFRQPFEQILGRRHVGSGLDPQRRRGCARVC